MSEDPMPIVILRCFASAREAAGTGRAELRARTLGDALADAEARFGDAFAAVLASSRVWVNGEPAEPGAMLAAGDEVAVLPPVSGGASASGGSPGPRGVPGPGGVPGPPGAG
jgi:molybdopterin synthase sulfur carrier subunit